MSGRAPKILAGNSLGKFSAVQRLGALMRGICAGVLPIKAANCAVEMSR